MIGNIDGVNNDHVQGWALDEDDPTSRVALDLYYNGALCTTMVAGFPRPDLLRANVGDGMNGFYVELPTLVDPEDAEIVVKVAGTDELIGEPKHIRRQAKCSPKGLLAADVLKLHTTPLHSIQGMTFNGETMSLHGIHLPPEGNPFKLSARSTPGTVFEFRYPMHSPAVGDWYWYWPNSHFSAFQIDIDVTASTGTSPHFEFWFELDTPNEAFTAMDRNHLRIPKDLAAYQNFPTGDNLTRVQRFDNNRRVALAGYNDYRQVATLAESYGADL